MEQLITSNFKLGIIAGMQLEKMLAFTECNWDVKHIFQTLSVLQSKEYEGKTKDYWFDISRKN